MARAMALVGMLFGASCSRVNELRVTSRDDARVLEPQIVTSVYRMTDANTADIYLSDIPREQLVARLARSAEGASGAPGTIVHLHLFLVPEAGRTPIESTASNASITQLVLTGETSGVYGGGGFLFLSSSVGDRWLRGRMRGGTVRLTRADDGFVDRLGPSIVSGVIVAGRDDALAEMIGAQMLRALNLRSVNSE